MPTIYRQNKVGKPVFGKEIGRKSVAMELTVKQRRLLSRFLRKSQSLTITTQGRFAGFTEDDSDCLQFVLGTLMRELS